MTDPMPGLREELVAAARCRVDTPRLRARRARAPLAAAAAAIAVAAVLGVAATTPDPAAAGVEITVGGGRIEVLLTDLEARPEVVEDALRDAGFDASVETVPVGPSMLGRFVGIDASLAYDLQPFDRIGVAYPGFAVPESFRDTLPLRLGTLAAPGETYEFTADAYAPGEALSCLGVYGSTVRQVPALLTGTEFAVRVQPYVDGAPAGPAMTLDDALDGPNRGFIASDALAYSDRDVLIAATADGLSPFTTPVSTDQGRCRE